MSVLPASVYANPVTPNFEPDTTGGGLNPTVTTLSFTTPGPAILSDQLALGTQVYGGLSSIVAVKEKTSGDLGPLQIGTRLEVQYGGGNPPDPLVDRMLYFGNGFTFQQATTGTSIPILAVTPSPGPNTVALTNISTINGAPVFTGAPIAYGSFAGTAAQMISGGLTPTPLTYDVALVTPVGITSTLPSSDITVTDTGTYRISTSVTVAKLTATSAPLDLWCAVAGSPIQYSGRRITVDQNQYVTWTTEWIVNLLAASSVSIVAFDVTTAGGLQTYQVLAIVPSPDIPAITTTITRLA